MRTFKHGYRLPDLYICPDYTLCRRIRTPCSRGVPHRSKPEAFCIEPMPLNNIKTYICKYMGEVIIE